MIFQALEEEEKEEKSEDDEEGSILSKSLLLQKEDFGNGENVESQTTEDFRREKIYSGLKWGRSTLVFSLFSKFFIKAPT